jgi:hypothetical protein
LEGGLKLENYHFIAITVKIGSGQSHPWVPNLGEEFEED